MTPCRKPHVPDEVPDLTRVLHDSSDDREVCPVVGAYEVESSRRVDPRVVLTDTHILPIQPPPGHDDRDALYDVFQGTRECSQIEVGKTEGVHPLPTLSIR